jgi:phage terminase large subunit-like protein
MFPNSENVSDMADTRTAKEGRVNIPLGKAKSNLKALAAKHGTSESNLGRVLILDGLERLRSGEIKFRGPSIEGAA